MEKITYASLGSLGEEFHSQFDRALETLRTQFGRRHGYFINGKSLKGRTLFPDVSPVDSRVVLGEFAVCGRREAQIAIAAARSAFPNWRDTPWPTRVASLRRAAEIMTERQFELAAILTLEVGKNRFEAIAEVSEAIDLLLYYCQQFEFHGGFEIPLVTTGKEQTKSILRPYGVWAVISPFNFPLALATGMAAAALVAGNTVVFKPASDTPWSGVCLAEIFCDAGLPDGVFNLVSGPGRIVGEELITNPDVDGLVFTGSQEIGLKNYHRFAQKLPKPCIVEMGGKNPALVMPSANLEDATEGVVRSAFGMGGQKCSACSRVYVHKAVAKNFVEALVARTVALKVGDPAQRDVFLGPLINSAAVSKFEAAARRGRRQGRVLLGGNRLKKDEFVHGYFVEPTIVDRLPLASVMFQEEYFAPILAVAEVKSLDDALTLANATDYGLTAGIFTNDDAEQKQFFDHIEAGVTYCNRRGGATTGAWPGVQSFGGWKGSGSSGKSALGPYYVQQFMREQSQTIVR